MSPSGGGRSRCTSSSRARAASSSARLTTRAHAGARSASTASHRQRQWDAVATVEAPDLDGEEAIFVALGDGTLVTETDDLDVEPLADGLEETIEPPYRAEAIRRADGLWAVAARRITVVDVPDPVDGDAVTISIQAGERTVEVDGSQAFGSIPTLERLAGDDAVRHRAPARRQLWEVEVTPL